MHVVGHRRADRDAFDDQGRLAVLRRCDAEQIRLADVEVPIASPTTLMRTKDTSREQDKIDRSSPVSRPGAPASERLHMKRGPKVPDSSATACNCDI
jgi:hypothetical protein